MTAGNAQQDIQVTIGKNLSTAIIGGYKVEVSPDSNVVVYTNDGVQTKPAAGEMRIVYDMAGNSAAKGTQISISEDLNTIVLNGATIERAADGHLVISTPGIVTTKPGPANEGLLVPAAERTANRLLAAKSAPEIGDELEDGTVYAGISPDTGEKMYATAADAPGTYTFNEAAKYAKNLDANGHHDFRAPSKSELNVLWENRNKGKLKGTFNETGSYPAGWYWSSSPTYDYLGWAQRFRDGYQYDGRDNDSSLRCVRG